MRINQIARKFGIDNKDILEYLETIGMPGRSHSSSLDDGTMELLLQHFGKTSEPKKEETQKDNNRFARIRRPKGWKPEDEKPEEEDEDDGIEPSLAPPVEAGSAQTAPAGQAAQTTPITPQRDFTKKDHKKSAKKKKHPAEKKQKLKTIALEPKLKPGAEPEIIIEAPEITGEEIVEDKSPVPAADVESKTPTDPEEVIRREIQKLKQKQKKASEASEPKKDQGGRRPQRPQRRQQQPTGRTSRGKRAWKREKRERLENQIAADEQRRQRDLTVLKVHEATTLADIANGLSIDANELIGKLISLGVMAAINQRLDEDTIQIIAEEYGFEVEKVDLSGIDVFSQMWENDVVEERRVKRPPVVTIMGHVDHGKTKLLDAVRKTDVVSQEAGGITQHIGAYHVQTKAGEVVFLDTPGHAAFTAMRARGAMVTDIVILVVSAVEGVMPQTIEALHHAKAAGVPIIVAINKIDLENANLDRVKKQLSEKGLLAEDWGGDAIVAPISAITGEGVNDLLDSIILQSEMMELKADPECRGRGAIVEGRLEQGRGAVATLLIQQGTIRVGDPFVSGVYSGRVRAMMNDKGEPIESAGPSMPVEILGLEKVPSAGDPFQVVSDDSQAKQISARLMQIQRERELRQQHKVTLEDLHLQIQSGEVKDLRVIVKGDVHGSVDALCDSLMKIESDKVRVEILHNGVGAISESDIMLASASNAIIIGFNVQPHPNVRDLAKSEHVDINTYRVIYEVVDDIRKAMTGMLDKTFVEKIMGRGEIREVFRLSKGLSIAGSYVQEGLLQRNARCRLLRDSVIVHEGKLTSLKRFKEDAREVKFGMECGVGFERFNDVRVGDVVECYQVEEVAATL
ncbi:MAG: translation initiation factor IF-2 [Candidatus Hinthialibacter antarcticus]|nr:translation initiation factor IF-2 [Candidatus Hinthialibacter antarcticus]